MKHDGPKHEGRGAAAPYALSRLSAPHDLVDMAREIQAADDMLGAVVGAKLESIAKQIRALQAEAADALRVARRDAQLHRAKCSFRKIPGHTYHLYSRADGELYFSLLSPQEWGPLAPHAYEGSFRLEADLRFTPADEIAAREREWAELRPLLGAPKE